MKTKERAASGCELVGVQYCERVDGVRGMFAKKRFFKSDIASGQYSRVSAIFFLAIFLLSTAYGSAVADQLKIILPASCQSYDAESETGQFPFERELGDPRFFPKPLALNSDTQTSIAPGFTAIPASGVQVDNARLLLANYAKIFSIDMNSTVQDYTVSFEGIEPGRYVPTGLAIGPHSGRIYVANYLANDILVGQLEQNRIVFDQRIKSDDLISPENVSVSDDENWVVSANFDGSSATAFRKQAGGYAHAWRTEIPNAHGVAIFGNRVFVSSLGLRKIFVLNLADGSIIGSFGRPGWRAYCLNFLWPTSVITVNDGLVITDAHTGGVYRVKVDGDTITLTDVVGGNFAGANGLQMPYASARFGDDIAIISTFSPKILIVGTNKESPLTLKRIIAQSSAQMVISQNVPAPIGVGWNGYANIATSHPIVSGIEMTPAYGSLIEVPDVRPLPVVPRMFFFNNDAASIFGSLMYFVEARELRKGVILSSPSTAFALYITTGRSSCVWGVRLPGGAFATKDGLRHRLGITPYTDIEREALDGLRQLDAKRDQDGLLGGNAIAAAFGKPEAVVRDTMHSPEAKASFFALERCKNAGCTQPEQKAIYENFRGAALANMQTNLLELLFIDMMTKRCTDQQ